MSSQKQLEKVAVAPPHNFDTDLNECVKCGGSVSESMTFFPKANKTCGHKEWRKIAKRERRRRIRVHKAVQLKEREKEVQTRLESTPGYESWLKEQEALEVFERLELERMNQEENDKWLRAECTAQKLWNELQRKIERARIERVEQEMRIRKEWEQEQQKVKETQEKLQKIEEQKQRNYRDLMEKLELFLTGSINTLPEELMTSSESKPNAEPCPFFSKTASCRFGDVCSRNHIYPTVSKVLVALNFYTQFDTDLVLEYDDKDTYKEFKNFFFDVLPEFEKFGEVIQFKVCCNWEKHLRGNTYVEYAELRCALAAYRSLHARWYAGRQLSLTFCNIPSWSTAVCGMYLGRRCPKGRSCNFFHVFKNPDEIFDRRQTKKTNRESTRDKETPRNWRWSESPEPDPKQRSRSSCRSSRNPRKRRQCSISGRKHESRRRSRSRSRNRNRTSGTKNEKLHKKYDRK